MTQPVKIQTSGSDDVERRRRPRRLGTGPIRRVVTRASPGTAATRVAVARRRRRVNRRRPRRSHHRTGRSVRRRRLVASSSSEYGTPLGHAGSQPRHCTQVSRASTTSSSKSRRSSCNPRMISIRPRGDLLSSPVTRNVGQCGRHKPHPTQLANAWSLTSSRGTPPRYSPRPAPCRLTRPTLRT